MCPCICTRVNVYIYFNVHVLSKILSSCPQRPINCFFRRVNRNPSKQHTKGWSVNCMEPIHGQKENWRNWSQSTCSTCCIKTGWGAGWESAWERRGKAQNEEEVKCSSMNRGEVTQAIIIMRQPGIPLGKCGPLERVKSWREPSYAHTHLLERGRDTGKLPFPEHHTLQSKSTTVRGTQSVWRHHVIITSTDFIKANADRILSSTRQIDIASWCNNTTQWTDTELNTDYTVCPWTHFPMFSWLTVLF